MDSFEKSSPLPFREAIRGEALAAGFDRVGFARAGPAPHAEQYLQWISRGFAGAMDYLSRNSRRRMDPREILQDARTVMALALHYGSADPAEGSSKSGEEARELAKSGRGEISRYARGTDYHLVLEARLVKLCRILKECHPPHRFRYYVDTGPILERSWAEAAGIGWIGKNCCALDPQRGSYFFIGIVLTTLEIQPDSPSPNHCGSCRLCMDACPTAAIVEPYRIDARRCISYLTIENRHAIPEEFRSSLGGLVFGCDICQEVCPFNRPEWLRGDPELSARPENLQPSLEDLVKLSREAFQKRFPQSAVRRAKWKGFLRNVLIGLGNGAPSVPCKELERCMEREELRGDPVLREALYWASSFSSRGGGGSA